jgi:hypothetical protein
MAPTCSNKDHRLCTIRDMNASVTSILNLYRKENDIMRTTLHTLIGTAVLGVALYASSPPAWAGTATRNEVYISPNRTNVQGSLTGARYSKDSEQFLACDFHSARGSTTPLVYCHARDKRGNFFMCKSTDPRIADAVEGMIDSSHLNIVASPGPLGEYLCTDLTISNESLYLP